MPPGLRRAETQPLQILGVADFKRERRHSPLAFLNSFPGMHSIPGSPVSPAAAGAEGGVSILPSSNPKEKCRYNFVHFLPLPFARPDPLLTPPPPPHIQASRRRY